MMKNNIYIWGLIVVLFIGGLIFLAKNSKPAEIMAKNGDIVSVNYTGKLADGTVFDSNVDPKFGHVAPFDFTLGEGRVIPGWEKGILGMKVG